MWIIPNSLLESWSGAPDTAALEWDSSELSETCEQSLTRRSNFSAAKSWRAVWKRGKSTLPRFGRILNLSHANAFEEWWISSLPVTPASHSARRAKGKAKKTQGTSGPSSKGQLVMFDLTGSSARTSQATLPSALKTSATTWTNWVTKLRRDCSRREKSASRTRDNASSSWPTIRAQEPGWTSDGYGDNLMKRIARSTESARPTPRSSEYKDVGPVGSKSHDHMLEKRYLCATVTKLESTSPPPDPDQSNTGGNPPESWPTATVGDSANAANETAKRKNEDSKHHEGTTLVDAMRNWATPQASDHVEGARTAPESNQKCLGRDLATQEQGSARPTPQEDDSSNVNPSDKRRPTLVTHTSKGTGMKLSPRWVEALMGLPIGWTDPTCSRPISPWEAVYTAASMNSEPSETE